MITIPTILRQALQEAPHPFVITGAGGWLGQALLAALQESLGDDCTQRVVVFGREERDMALPAGGTLHVYNLEQLSTRLPSHYFMMHLAFMTRDKVADMSLPDYMAANTAIREHVLANMQKTQCQGLFVPSSGAVYMPRQCESDSQTLDDQCADNPYGWLKQQDEQIFSRLAETQHFAASIIRLFNLSGPYINKQHLYALSSMIGQAQEHRHIRIQATRPVYRSFVHVWDLLALGCLSILKPQQEAQPLQIVDSRGVEVIEMQELAETIMDVLGQDGKAIERPALLPELPADYYVGQAAVFQNGLSGYRLTATPLKAQIRDTADYLRRSSLVPSGS